MWGHLRTPSFNCNVLTMSVLHCRDKFHSASVLFVHSTGDFCSQFGASASNRCPPTRDTSIGHLTWCVSKCIKIYNWIDDFLCFQRSMTHSPVLKIASVCTKCYVSLEVRSVRLVDALRNLLHPYQILLFKDTYISVYRNNACIK